MWLVDIHKGHVLNYAQILSLTLSESLLYNLHLYRYHKQENKKKLFLLSGVFMGLMSFLSEPQVVIRRIAPQC